MGFPGGLDGKESACNAGNPASVSDAGRSPAEGEGEGRSPGEEYSSSLAQIIPWTEEPGRLQFMGSQRVGHDWVTNTLLSIQSPLSYPLVEFYNKMLNFLTVQVNKILKLNTNHQNYLRSYSTIVVV